MNNNRLSCIVFIIFLQGHSITQTGLHRISSKLHKPLKHSRSSTKVNTLDPSLRQPSLLLIIYNVINCMYENLRVEEFTNFSKTRSVLRNPQGSYKESVKFLGNYRPEVKAGERRSGFEPG